MRNLTLSLCLAALLLAACYPGLPTLPPDPKTPIVISAAPSVLPPAARAARLYLAGSLGVPEESVTVVSVNEVSWPDSCLGTPTSVPQAGCTPPEVPGYKVLLQANGVIYEFHTNESGSDIQEVPYTDTQPAAVVAAQALLARRLLLDSADAVLVDSFQQVEWPDGCLGVTVDAAQCPAGSVQGFSIQLTAHGGDYELHTDQTGDRITVASAPAADRNSQPISWKSKGEPCRLAAIGPDGVIFGPCSGVSMAAPFINPARPKELDQILSAYSAFSAETPAGTVLIAGTGTVQPTDSDRRRVAEWASIVYQEADLGHTAAALGLVMSWRREGGSGSACDDLAVYTSGIVYAVSCQGGQTRPVGSVMLSGSDLDLLYAWLDGSKAVDFSLAAGDGTNLQMLLLGSGGAPPDDTAKAAMLDAAARWYDSAVQSLGN